LLHVGNHGGQQMPPPPFPPPHGAAGPPLGLHQRPPSHNVFPHQQIPQQAWSQHPPHYTHYQQY
jgi:hypothetical protein